MTKLGCKYRPLGNKKGNWKNTERALEQKIEKGKKALTIARDEW